MNYRELTKQELFNITWKGASSQDFKTSADHNGDCVYFSPDGNRCAAGWHIPDAAAVKGQNGGEVWEVRFFQENFDEWQIDFLGGLQVCHDEADGYSPDKYKRALIDQAEFHGLTIPE